VFQNAFPFGQRLDVGDPVAEPYGRDRKPVDHQGFGGLVGERARCAAVVEHEGCGPTCQRRDIHRVGNRIEVEVRGLAGDQNQIGELGCNEGRALRLRGRVNDDKVGASVASASNQIREVGAVAGKNDRGIGRPQPRPAGRALLRIEIDDDDALALERGGDGEVQADRGLTGTALLGNECNDFHAHMLSRPPTVGNGMQACAHVLLHTERAVMNPVKRSSNRCSITRFADPERRSDVASGHIGEFTQWVC